MHVEISRAGTGQYTFSTGHTAMKLDNSDVRLDNKRHLLFIFAGKNHFDLGNEVNTAAKCQSWCFSLKAESREIHHEGTAVSLSAIKSSSWFQYIAMTMNDMTDLIPLPFGI